MSSADSPLSATPPPPSDETPNQRAARLRRERRQAKISASAPDRLAAITGVQGRKGSDLDLAAAASLSSSHNASRGSSRPGTPSGKNHASVEDAGEVPDPDHMDIGEFMPASAAQGRLGGGRGGAPGGPGGPGGDMFAGLPPEAQNDPMIQMLQQLMGNANMPPHAGLGGQQSPDGLPDLASLLGAAGAGGIGGGGLGGPLGALFGDAPPAEPEVPPTVSATTWKVIHAVTLILLALFIIFSSPVPFAGSKSSRELADLSGVGSSSFGSRLFFWFATVEIVLQSSRFVLERGQVASTGWVGTLTKVLPEPWAGYLRIAWRYSVMGSTVVGDGLVLVFVLGVVAWWNGADGRV